MCNFSRIAKEEILCNAKRREDSMGGWIRLDVDDLIRFH